MKNILIISFSMLFLITACTDLDQFPKAASSSDSLTEYGAVLNAAYGYHGEAAAPMAVFGDFRADNAIFDETPFTDFANFSNNNLTSSMSNDFFQPFYRTLYKSILSANGVIENSTNATQVGEAKFLRALSYFKLVQVFGDVTVNTSASPDISDASILTRQAKSSVLTSVIIPDLQAAMSALNASSAAAANGRATSNAAQALLGKVYASMGDYGAAAAELSAVINGAAGSGISLQDNFTDVFNNDLNSEIIFATQMSSAVGLTGELFTNWYAGANTKADPVDNAPISADLIAAFAASDGDSRTALTLDGTASVKYTGASTDPDWIEIRLADVILLHAEAMNETGSSADAVLALLDPIRTRAGLGSLVGTASSQAEVRKAILDERRLEMACEGQRWFDLQRANAASPGMLDAEMGQTINSNYYVFPIPITEVTSFDEIVQNTGY